ncbi:hypothetical protein CXB51_024021 [Gossypium anomalum]|uniref:DUF7745 domain-containing protein n=1 Tax=Gossypium anomalum TaxID=47600 RepID=A0A8J6CWL0_9ROSI|nr:hypothetical protein CXB51_024021 [Gossypium anomalum]
MTVVVAPLSGTENLLFREVFTFAWASGLLPGYICTYVFVKFSSPGGQRFCLRVVRENPVREGDSVTEGYTLELWDFTRISSTQNEFQELKDIWTQWGDEAKQLFYQNYGDLPYLLDTKVNKHLFRAMVQFWNPAYSCFTFGEVDLVPTLKEYTTLLRCLRIQGNKAYVRAANLPTFMKKLMMITGMSEQWAAARIQQKGDGKCIPWASLRDLILAHPDVKKRVNVLALSIYGLVIFPKAMGHIDEAVANLFDRLGKQNTPMPAILAETFRSLSACRRAGEGRFIRCAQLLKQQLRRGGTTLQRKGGWKYFRISERKMLCRKPFGWLLMKSYIVAEALIGYLFLEFGELLGDHYKKKIREISEAWKKICYVKILTEGPTTTLEYKGWFSKRINDNIPRPSLGATRSIEENLRVIPSELEVIKQEFERKSLELGKKIEKLEEEKMYLSLDVDVQKIEVEKVRKEKRKIEED